MSCSVCFKTINRKSDLKVSCCTCHLLFHSVCVNLLEEDVAFHNEKNNYICVVCVRIKKNADHTTGINTSLTNTDEVLKSPKGSTTRIASMPQADVTIATKDCLDLSDINATLKEFNLILQETRKTVSNLNMNITSQITKLESRFTSFESTVNLRFDELENRYSLKLNSLEKKYEVVLQENNILKSNLLKLRSSTDHLENFTKQAYLEFDGIPATNTSTARANIITIIQNGLNLSLSDEQILDCVKIKTGKYLVQFSNIDNKQKILKRSKENRSNNLNSKTLFNTDGENKIYINECMSSNQKMLLYNAKKINRDKNLNYKYVWFSFGSVKMRKKDGDVVVHINDIADLNKIVLLNN